MTTARPAQILLLEGADAIAFAQAQLSSNVQSLAAGRWQFSAWLDAQGRVLVLLQLARLPDDTLALLLRGGDANVLASSLQRFVFRSKVKLSVLDALSLSTGNAVEMHAAHRDGDAYVFGCGDHSMIAGSAAEDDKWRLPQVRAGWPWLPHNVLGHVLAPALSLERLQAIAFDKGCYPGQEIVARLHYRGGLKRHMHCVVLSQHVDGGNVLHRNGDKSIQLLDAVHTDAGIEALAVLDDGLTNSLDHTSHIDTDEGITLRVAYSWPA